MKVIKPAVVARLQDVLFLISVERYTEAEDRLFEILEEIDESSDLYEFGEWD